MKKSRTLIITVLLILSLGAFVLIQNNKDAAVTNESVSDTESSEKLTTSSMPVDQSPGVYTEYSEAAFNNASGKKLLFFHAPWCRQCQMIEADIVQNGLPANVNVFKVDYDTSIELRKKYEVTLQTTFVNVANDGSLIKKYVAYEQPNLNSVLENAL